KPIAVFTDGFQFHKDKVADDTLKRMAIIRSGNFHVWSLSWRDVQSVFQTQGDYYTNTLNAMAMPYGAKVYQPTVSAGNADTLHPNKMGTFELLMRYLAEPEAEAMFAAQAKAYSVSLLDPTKMTNALAFVDWQVVMNLVIQQSHFTDESYEQNKTLFGKWSPRTENSHLCVYSGISTSTMKVDKNAPVAVVALLDDVQDHRSDKFENEWNGFWHFSNVMQFDPVYFGVSQTGLDTGVYLELPIQNVTDENETVIESEKQDLWTDIYELLFDDEVKQYAKQLSEAGIPIPDEVGYEVTGEDGEVIAMAELAWTQDKIAFLTGEQEQDAGVFESLRWTVFNMVSDISKIDFGGERA
ncbi:MAG: helicase, partial [Lachnospiraceae bacterium]|nr:helicase [Lachnospiraceae bacterium]